MRLYELSDAYQMLLEMEAEDPEAWKQALDDIRDDFETKVTNIAFLVRNLQVDKEAFDSEIKRLSGHSSAIANKAARLTAYLKVGMQEAGIDHVKGIIDVRLQNNPPAVEVDDAVIGQDWMRARITMPMALVPEEVRGAVERGLAAMTTEPDRAGIKDALEKGVEVAGAQLIRGQHVRFR